MLKHRNLQRKPYILIIIKKLNFKCNCRKKKKNLIKFFYELSSKTSKTF